MSCVAFSRWTKDHAQSTAGGFVYCIFLSYNGKCALYSNNLVSHGTLLRASSSLACYLVISNDYRNFSETEVEPSEPVIAIFYCHPTSFNTLVVITNHVIAQNWVVTDQSPVIIRSRTASK